MTTSQDPVAIRILAHVKAGELHAHLRLVEHVKAGKLLLAMKDKHQGKYLAWVKENLGHNRDWTAKFTRLALRHPDVLSDNTSIETAQAILTNHWGNQYRQSDDGPRSSNLDIRAFINRDYPSNEASSFEWYTPPKYVALVKAVFGGHIDLDPASCVEANTKWVKAKKFYTKEQDGLDFPWRGKVYINPPFQSKIATKFVKKLIEEMKAGNVTQGIMLTMTATDTAGFQPIFDNAALLCFPRRRVNYISVGKDHEQPGTPFSSVFSYFGGEPEKFEVVFREIGNIAVPKH